MKVDQSAHSGISDGRIIISGHLAVCTKSPKKKKNNNKKNLSPRKKCIIIYENTKMMLQEYIDKDVYSNVVYNIEIV